MINACRVRKISVIGLASLTVAGFLAKVCYDNAKRTKNVSMLDGDELIEMDDDFLDGHEVTDGEIDSDEVARTSKRIVKDWDKIKKDFGKEYDLTPISYNLWIEPLQIVTVVGNTIIVAFPQRKKDTLKKYAAEKYKPVIEEYLKECYGVKYELFFAGLPL